MKSASPRAFRFRQHWWLWVSVTSLLANIFGLISPPPPPACPRLHFSEYCSRHCSLSRRKAVAARLAARSPDCLILSVIEFRELFHRAWPNSRHIYSCDTFKTPCRYADRHWRAFDDISFSSHWCFLPRSSRSILRHAKHIKSRLRRVPRCFHAFFLDIITITHAWIIYDRDILVRVKTRCLRYEGWA